MYSTVFLHNNSVNGFQFTPPTSDLHNPKLVEPPLCTLQCDDFIITNMVPRAHLLCIRISIAIAHFRGAHHCINKETCFITYYFLNEGHHSSTPEFGNILYMVGVKIGTYTRSTKNVNTTLLHRVAPNVLGHNEIVCANVGDSFCTGSS